MKDQHESLEFDRDAEPLEPDRTFQRLVPDEGLIGRVPNDMGEEAPDVTDVFTGNVPADPRSLDSTFNVDFRVFD